MDQYRTIDRTPSPEAYIRMRELCGLAPRSLEAASAGLSGSLYCVLALEPNAAPEAFVGMARIVGDGGSFFEVVDMAVHPDHQGKGLGDLLMRALMAWIETNVPATAYVSLIAADGKAAFYERYGFRSRPMDAPGMELVRTTGNG